MRKLITTTLLAMLLGVSGLSLSACDRGDDVGPGARGVAPDNPNQGAPLGGAPNDGGMGY